MFCFPFNLEPRKEKTEYLSGNNGMLSPSNEQPSQGALLQISGNNETNNSTPKLERPNSLMANKMSRRVICYHDDECKWIFFF